MRLFALGGLLWLAFLPVLTLADTYSAAAAGAKLASILLRIGRDDENA